MLMRAGWGWDSFVSYSSIPTDLPELQLDPRWEEFRYTKGIKQSTYSIPQAQTLWALRLLVIFTFGSGVQDWSLQCPSNAIIWPFKTQPQIENEVVTWSPQYNLPATRTNKRRALSLQRSRVRWLILISSHCIGNMYHIIQAQTQYEFCISFLYSWIDVLHLNQPSKWSAEIWEPFKMKLIWGLQSWTLFGSSINESMGQGCDICCHCNLVHRDGGENAMIFNKSSISR